mmetsp:Transcript_44371/g.128377  ORF Transcript_44371/g.128377 Transcript_44371/m.128377 type:complete len:253 (+) Transcript_44371:34-792(+)
MAPGHAACCRSPLLTPCDLGVQTGKVPSECWKPLAAAASSSALREAAQQPVLARNAHNGDGPCPRCRAFSRPQWSWTPLPSTSRSVLAQPVRSGMRRCRCWTGGSAEEALGRTPSHAVAPSALAGGRSSGWRRGNSWRLPPHPTSRHSALPRGLAGTPAAGTWPCQRCRASARGASGRIPWHSAAWRSCSAAVVSGGRHWRCCRGPRMGRWRWRHLRGRRLQVLCQEAGSGGGRSSSWLRCAGRACGLAPRR